MKRMCFTAFDHGITHFDVANNYGPEPGSAEVHLGRILKEEMVSYRDELIISTKAGYLMWDGPYGDWGSRKYVLASLDQSLKRMSLEYVDIFYHHECLGLGDQIVEIGGLQRAGLDRKSTRLNSSHSDRSRMPSSA